MKKSDMSIIAGLIIALVITFFTDTNTHAANIRQQTLRLHIIADDNSRQAQDIKMMVKNSIAGLCSEIYCDAQNYDDAIRITKENLIQIENTVNSILKSAGAGYTAICSIESFYFDTTSYTGFTLPQGEYTALTIRLGRARGHNWWCVMYPALCLSAAAEYDSRESSAFITTPKFRIRFKTVEIWEDIKTHFIKSPPAYENY
ncbi:MAG: stage II sporulation protein R [Oscillospiraceae bacterium]|nr:stage II sporulation protein R [Oscillospiraceae bacterium]